MGAINYKFLVDKLPCAVIRSDVAGKIIFANDAAKRIFGENLVGQDALSLYGNNPGRQSITPRSVKVALVKSSEAQITNLTIPLRVVDGSYQDMLCSFSWNPEDDTVDGVIVPGVIELHTAIARVAESMVKNSQLESILKVITEEALRLCKARRAYIKRYDPKQEALVLSALSSTSKRERAPEAYSDTERGMTGYVFRTGRLYRSGNVKNEPSERYHELFSDTVSEVVAPLLFEERYGRRCYGVLCIDGTEPDQFDVETDEVLTTLAKHAAIAIAQANLIQEVRTSYEQILSEIHYSRDAITGGKLLHDGKNMVRDVIHDVQVIQQELSETSHSKKKAKDLQAKLNGLRDLHDLMTVILKKLVKPSEQKKRADEADRADLFDIARRVVDIIPLGDSNVEIEWMAEEDRPYLVYGEPTRILLILYNLVTNAVTAIRSSERAGKITIHISDTPNMKGFRRLHVEDDGPGLTKEIRDFIRDAEPVDSGSPGGTGLGLLTVRESIKELKGRIDVDSRYGKFTKYIIDLPGPEDET